MSDQERERVEREARMRAAGHVAPTDDEAQATFDATIYAVEWEPQP